MLEFREPLWMLLAILAIPFYFWMRHSAGHVRFSSLRIWPTHIKSFKLRTSFVPPLMICAAFVLFCVALAGPRIPGGVVHQHRMGISMMMVVDKSGSMAALDMSKGDKEQDRLSALKDVLGDFIKGNGTTLSGRPDDAIGVVSFGSFPDSDCPLTLDHLTLMQIVQDIQIAEQNESGTAIGDALGLAVERLRESPGESKVIVLLTDGVNNTGYEEPLDAARMAAQFGIKVYTIGIGTNGMAPIRVRHRFTGRMVIQQYPVEIDEDTLQKISDITGGHYFRATNRQGLEDIYKKIDKMEKTKISEDRITHYDEKYGLFLAIGLILAVCGLILRQTYYRRSP